VEARSSGGAIKAVGGPRRVRKAPRTPNPRTAARLLSAAADLIGHGGFRGLRVEEVAERAGVSVGTFYLYFDGKDDLLVQLIVDHTARLRQRLAAAYGAGGPFAARMRRALDAYLGFVEEDEARFLCALRDGGTIETTVGQLSTWVTGQHATDLRPVVEQAMATGELRRDDATLVSQAIMGVVQHLAGFWLQHRDHWSRDDLRCFLERSLLSAAPYARPSPL
jgi:AcrR family transcriptional regulator